MTSPARVLALGYAEQAATVKRLHDADQPDDEIAYTTTLPIERVRLMLTPMIDAIAFAWRECNPDAALPPALGGHRP
jgi:hypothetical protein